MDQAHLHGADVGDVWMIHACQLCDAKPFEYLKVLQRHIRDVVAAPSEWMPWNYREKLELGTSPGLG